MKSTAPNTSFSHPLTSHPHTHTFLKTPEHPVLCAKSIPAKRSPYLHVWAQQEWHNGTGSFGDGIRKVSHGLAVLTEPRGRRK